MRAPAAARSLRRAAARLGLAGCALWPAPLLAPLPAPLPALWPTPAAAQGLGFAPLPAFALPDLTWPGPSAGEDPARADRWAGSYAALSTGFAAASSRRLGGYAGPTLGFEGGRLWREGPFVYGLVGGVDALLPAAGGGPPGFGRLSYARDFAGALQAQAGVLLTPDVLVYAKAGGWAVHETLRAGPASAPSAREGLALRPDARAGVAWAVTDRLTLSLEAGAARGGFPW